VVLPESRKRGSANDEAGSDAKMGADQSKKMNEDEFREFTSNTSFTGEEIKEWYNHFYKESPSGQMTKPEFMTMYSKMFPQGDCRKFAEHIFKAYDADESGTVDFKEFLCTLSVCSRGAIDDKLKWAFHLYDIDGNGYVTKQECVEIIKGIYKMRGLPIKSTQNSLSPMQTVDEIFSKIDVDNDNQLSETEFIMGAKNEPAILSIIQNMS